MLELVSIMLVISNWIKHSSATQVTGLICIQISQFKQGGEKKPLLQDHHVPVFLILSCSLSLVTEDWGKDVGGYSQPYYRLLK